MYILKEKNLHEDAQLKISCSSEENTESYNLAQKLFYDTYYTEKKSTFNRK